ncbi:MAG: hypothetical protein Q9162_006445 [Coniocarpon cinnabarinum]
MATPMDEKHEQFFAAQQERSSDEEGTVVGESNTPYRNRSAHGNPPPDSSEPFLSPLKVTQTDREMEDDLSQVASPNREQAHRLDDDLHMLSVERQVSADLNSNYTDGERGTSKARSSVGRSRTRHEEPVDEFDAATNPLHERTQVYSPPSHPETKIAKFFKKIHNSNWLVRTVTYITPLVAIILIPILIGFLLPAANGTQRRPDGSFKQKASIGGLLAKCLPWPIGLIASLFTNNNKKWRDMCKQLEIAATIFFWQLGVEISFLPVMRTHKVNPNADLHWTEPMNKVLVSFLVVAVLNFAEKIIIQLIAISFHLRTYSDRIEINKFQISSLTKLYQYSKNQIAAPDSEFEQAAEAAGSGTGSGAITPGQYVEKAQKTTKEAFNKFGDAAGKIAGDFTGKAVKQSGHPHQVILSLLQSPGGSQVLARRLYRTFAKPGYEVIESEDLKAAFDNEEETNAAFSMFDKDMNNDISMEELEAVCVEIGRERKSITASLKDLDSVVSKLDDVFMFIVFVIFVLVLISLLSTSAAGILTSAGSAVLALSWLFSATAQEFLQSCIFVFVKHPFDVGDRVTIYGNTGTTLTGDDYFVKEISLLYTEFKKLEGHVVQAPNSYLNTLFILNMRRSGGLAEAIPLILKYGTSEEQLLGLKEKMVAFVREEKREYQSNILTELRSIDEVHSVTFNLIFFFKSNWQNELVRLQRRNKFILQLMRAMQELKIEGPRMRYPGMREQFPVYMQHMPFEPSRAGHHGHPDDPYAAEHYDQARQFPPNATPASGHEGFPAYPGGGRPRGETVASRNRRVELGLTNKDFDASDMLGDVHDDRERSQSRAARFAVNVQGASPRASNHQTRDRSTSVVQGRSSSISDRMRPGHLMHRGTEPAKRTSTSIHRNNFFGRNVSHEGNRMEEGMAGIPEERTTPATRIDPRSGLISPAAMRMDTNESAISGQQTTHVPRAQTSRQDFGASM